MEEKAGIKALNDDILESVNGGYGNNNNVNGNRDCSLCELKFKNSGFNFLCSNCGIRFDENGNEIKGHL